MKKIMPLVNIRNNFKKTSKIQSKDPVVVRVFNGMIYLSGTVESYFNFKDEPEDVIAFCSKEVVTVHRRPLSRKKFDERKGAVWIKKEIHIK